MSTRPLRDVSVGDRVTFIGDETREVVAEDSKFLYFDHELGKKPVDRHMLAHAIEDGIATLEGGDK